MSRSWKLINMIELCKIRNKYTWDQVAQFSGLSRQELRACLRRGDPNIHTTAYGQLEAGLKKLLAVEKAAAKKDTQQAAKGEMENKLYSIAMLMGVDNCIKFLNGVRQGAVEGSAD